MDYQAHQPPKTFKFPEIVYGKKKKNVSNICEYFFVKKMKEGA